MLDEAPSSFPIRLFAAGSFRVRVNGRTAAGASAFSPAWTRLDLAPWLAPGENEVIVEAVLGLEPLPPGCLRGFIAEGGLPGWDMATPGEWTAAEAAPWSDRVLPGGGGWSEARDVLAQSEPASLAVLGPAGQTKDWGREEAPSLMPVLVPDRLEAQGANPGDEDLYGLVFDRPACAGLWAGAAFWIWSPCGRRVQAWFSFGHVLVNGRPLPVAFDPEAGSRGAAELALTEGWNILTGEMEVSTKGWTCLLAFPKSAGIRLCSRRSLDAPGQASISSPGPRSELFLPGAQDRDPLPGWREVQAGWRQALPAQLCSWDRLDAGSGARLSTWGFDDGFWGHAVADVEGAEGTILDLAVDDWQRDGGLAALRSGGAWSADRFILGGGRQAVELFFPRGGRFVQAALRPPEGGDAELHGLWIRSRQAVDEPIPDFESSDPLVDWAWKAGLQSLKSEGGTSGGSGGLLARLHLRLLLSPDLDPLRREIDDASPVLEEEGPMDGALLWIMALHDYWAASGDADLVRDLWPCLERIWRSPAWKVHPSGLWSLPPGRALIDSGCPPAEREGEAHAGLNILRAAAAKASARLASAAGRPAQPAFFEAEALRTEELLVQELWSPARGAFLPAREQTGSGLHANAWALAFGIGSPQQRQAILRFLGPLLDEGGSQGRLELPFLFFLLPALAENGRPDLAERTIAACCGMARGLGLRTMPEALDLAARGEGRACHAPSGGAAVYAARHVLGLRQAAPGDPDSFVCSPCVSGITEARGWLPHRRGRIEASWKKGEAPVVRAPQGVSVAIPAPPEE